MAWSKFWMARLVSFLGIAVPGVIGAGELRVELYRSVVVLDGPGLFLDT